MTGMVTYAGLDVHARSTYAAAIDVSTGELVRARFGPGVEEPVAWLRSLPGPVRGCYEAGPTRFGFYRAASAAGVAIEVIAPGETPRGPSDRVKTDRKDAELLARLLLAGSLTTVVVPPVEVEAARELDARPRCVPEGSDDGSSPGLEDAVASWPGLPRVLDLDCRSPALALRPTVR
jgi:transposase